MNILINNLDCLIYGMCVRVCIADFIYIYRNILQTIASCNYISFQWLIFINISLCSCRLIYLFFLMYRIYIVDYSRQIISISFLNRLGQSISRLGSSFFLLFLSSFHYFFSPLCFSALFFISRLKAYSSLVLAWIGCRLSENYKSEMYFWRKKCVKIKTVKNVSAKINDSEKLAAKQKSAKTEIDREPTAVETTKSLSSIFDYVYFPIHHKSQFVYALPVYLVSCSHPVTLTLGFTRTGTRSGLLRPRSGPRP